MAALMEEYIGGTKYYNSLPYCSAIKIAEKLCPKVVKYPLTLMAVCDISLMVANPAEMFMKLLNILHEFDKQELYANYHCLYEISKCLGLSYTKERKKDAENIYDVFEKSCQDVINAVDAIYLKITPQAGEWIKDIIINAKAKRLTSPSFIIDAISERKEGMNKLMKEMHQPIFIHKNKHCTIDSESKEEITSLVLIAHLYNVLILGFYECPLKNFCFDEIRNKDEVLLCDTEPWKMEEPCVFANLWETLFGKDREVSVCE